MEIYLVGGAVRDELLGLPVAERDWVVVGATPEEMIRLGYRQVGRDFPVFLHPDTNEEYALARTERKVAPGHTGFVCHAGPEVTLEDDLRRRDLTVNAIARSSDGALIDPWSGRRDVDARVLRHVSDAFAEDPLRVFRVARFAATLAPLGFRAADDTLALMREMAMRGDLRELAPERVCQELGKALAARAPAEFFVVLTQARALGDWFTELADEKNGAAIQRMLTRIAAELVRPIERFAAMGWHLEYGQARALATRLKVPRDWADSMTAVSRHGRELVRHGELAPGRLLVLLKELGALRHAQAFERVVEVVGTVAERDLEALIPLAAELRAVASDELRAKGLEGKALGVALDRARELLIERGRA